MRPTALLLSLALPIVLVACTEQTLPHFGKPIPISGSPGKSAYGPRLTQGSNEDAILSWMERDDDGARLKFTRYSDGSWQAVKVAIDDPNMFVNWADLPAVSRTGASSLLAYWLSYTADAPYAYQILTATSADNGESWRAPSSPHTDKTPTEHGFVSVFSTENASGLVWLDGRNTPDGAMTLRAAILGADGLAQDGVQLDDAVCDCCQTDVAEAETGAVAVDRNRTKDEVRDIFVTRYVDGQWQAGQPLSDDGWVVSGCPVNGPSISANARRVAAAWFTAANDKPVVKSAISTDGGQSFSSPAAIASEHALGRVGVAMINQHSFAVSWMESGRDSSYAIKIRGATFDGQLGSAMTVGRTSVARTVPQLIRVADNLVLAWTDEMNGRSKVVSVKVPLHGFYD